MNIMKCKACKAQLKHVNEEHFLYCSPGCLEDYKLIIKEELKKCNKVYMSKLNIPKTEGELRAMRCGAPTSKTPSNGKPKGKRKCGKCGASGHNARTCTKGSSSTGKEGKKYSMPTRGKKNLNTCGRCGGKGHNARTCGNKKR